MVTVLYEETGGLWFLAVVNDELLVQKALAVVAAGVQERDRKLIVRFGATVVVDGGSVHRVRTVRTSTELLQPGEYLFRLVTSSGNFLKIIITVTVERPGIQAAVIVSVPIHHFPDVGECSIHWMIFLFTNAASTATSGASVITSRPTESTTPGQ